MVLAELNCVSIVSAVSLVVVFNGFVLVSFASFYSGVIGSCGCMGRVVVIRAITGVIYSCWLC